MTTETEVIVFCPKCETEVWDIAGVGQALNKCWTCGARWMTDIDELEGE